MILRNIEIRNFRKFVDSVIVDDLGSGLTVIAGENEEGKSTLVDCIRAAFFVKHNVSGELATSFQPYHSNVRPEIRIDFELNGEPYSLFKAFCQRPEANLVTPNGRFAGMAAEEELSRLLRFSLPKRTHKDDLREHEGVFGMFWVEQGKSTILEPNDTGRTSIVQALQKEVGDILGGKRGERLLAEVKQLRDLLLTPMAKPRGAYAKAGQTVESTKAELSAVGQLLITHEQKTEDLERCRTKLNRYQQERTRELARQRLEAAQAVNDAVSRLQRAVQDAESTLSATKERHQVAAERLMQRNQASENLANAETALQQLAISSTTQQACVSVLRERWQAEEQTVKDAAIELDSAENTLRAAEAADRVALVRIELVRLNENRAAALIAKQDRETALAITGGITVDKGTVEIIKRLEGTVARARARVESLATHIRIRVEAGAEVALNGHPVIGEQQFTITSPTVVCVPQCMEIAIAPGSDVQDPYLQLDLAVDKLKEQLQHFNVQSLDDAENKLERRLSAINHAETSGRLVAVHAPNGLEKLDEQIVAVESELRRLQEIAFTSSSGEVGTINPKSLSQLRDDRDRGRLVIDGARRKAEQTRSELTDAGRAEVEAVTKYTVEKEHCADYRRRIEAARTEVTDADLNHNVLAAAQAVRTAETTSTATRYALEAADPESVARELIMAEAALRELNLDIDRLDREILRLESELRISGGLGLGERIHELQFQLSDAEAEFATLGSQAKTADLLWRMLRESENIAKEQFVRPVTERVQPYLRILLPGTELAFDEEIRIIGLRRGHTVEPFESLSVGTREQLAVLTRLAFADLLREHGQPATVLLDDAIVFADDGRFDRMLHILNKAAEHIQVIVLTCRERDYQRAGAPIIRLGGCMVQALAAI